MRHTTKDDREAPQAEKQTEERRPVKRTISPAAFYRRMSTVVAASLGGSVVSSGGPGGGYTVTVRRTGTTPEEHREALQLWAYGRRRDRQPGDGKTCEEMDHDDGDCDGCAYLCSGRCINCDEGSEYSTTWSPEEVEP